MGQIHIGDLFSKKVTKRRPIWAKSLLWRLSILKGDPFGNTAMYTIMVYQTQNFTLISKMHNYVDLSCVFSELWLG